MEENKIKNNIKVRGYEGVLISLEAKNENKTFYIARLETYDEESKVKSQIKVLDVTLDEVTILNGEEDETSSEEPSETPEEPEDEEEAEEKGPGDIGG